MKLDTLLLTAKEQSVVHQKLEAWGKFTCLEWMVLSLTMPCIA